MCNEYQIVTLRKQCRGKQSKAFYGIFRNFSVILTPNSSLIFSVCAFKSLFYYT